MTRIQQRASVHPTTVTRLSEDALELPKRKRLATSISIPESHSWEYKTNELVQAVVVASKAPVSHVQRVNQGTVVIWNHPAPWPEVTA